MESRWYFGIGIVSENQNTNSSITTGNPVQLHWQSCVFDEEGGRFIEIKNYILPVILCFDCYDGLLFRF